MWLILVSLAILQSFRKAPLASCSVVLYSEGTQAENSLEGVGWYWSKPPFWISINLRYLEDPDEAEKIIPFVWISPGEKKMGPNQWFL